MKYLKFSLVAALVLATSSVADTDYRSYLSGKSFEVTGSFGPYDFSDGYSQGSAAFDWAFTTVGGTTYQLQGVAPDDSSPFGWKAVDVSGITPAWYMLYATDDIDGDGTSRYDWILVSPNSQYALKLEGVSENGTFKYSDPIAIGYTAGSDGLSVTFETVTSEDNTTTTLDEKSAAEVATTLTDEAMLYQLGLDNADYSNQQRAKNSYGFEYNGSCGGVVNVTLDGSLSDGQSALSVGAAYDNYCSAYLQADGNISSAATFQLLELSSLEMSASGFTTQYGLIDGTLGFSFSNYKYSDLTGLAFSMKINGTVQGVQLANSVKFDDVIYDFANYNPTSLSFDYGVSGGIATQDGISMSVTTQERVSVVNLAPVSGALKVMVGDSDMLLFVQNGEWYVSLDLYGDDAYDKTVTLKELVELVKE